MKVFWFLLIMVTPMFMYGCCSRQVYDSMQHSAKMECQKLPEAEYAECMEQANAGYDEYTKKREEVVKQK